MEINDYSWEVVVLVVFMFVYLFRVIVNFIMYVCFLYLFVLLIYVICLDFEGMLVVIFVLYFMDM